MKNLYRVSFLTKKGGEKHWAYDVAAKSAKEAVKATKILWYEKYNDSRHMFYICTKIIRDDEELLYNCPVRVCQS